MKKDSIIGIHDPADSRSVRASQNRPWKSAAVGATSPCKYSRDASSVLTCQTNRRPTTVRHMETADQQ
ncbi:hypothetical protein T265_12379 [Opisthorchis viverrini]|uniref:Uncharacterized protein n=1 Tax=Opisthorchis viverrini TaxID=6198 RepID=A0A074YTP5_OPIVI|nr:hypothetical protein T265_12379 [Opisthorchis viverrini]KER18098.1 hypothetical protein T265_12379 [Opisthorchis viverrini]